VFLVVPFVANYVGAAFHRQAPTRQVIEEKREDSKRTLDSRSVSQYILLMTITQTVDIPASRRLTIDVPPEVPAGRTILVFKPVAEASECITAEEAINLGLGFGSGPHIDPMEAVKRCSGITKRLGFNFSSDDFLAMRRQDKELEERLDSIHEERQQYR